MNKPQLFTITFVASLIAACSPTPTCPVTIPNGSTPPGETANQLYHGNGQLWTALWPDSEIIFNPGGPGEIRSDGSLAMKIPWWRGEGIHGQIEVSGRRLDRPGSGVVAELPAGYSDSGFQPSALVFPSEGCWEITARVGEAELVFTVEVLRSE